MGEKSAGKIRNEEKTDGEKISPGRDLPGKNPSGKPDGGKNQLS